MEWREVSGHGEIYSFTIVRRAPEPAFESDLPYVVALVQLDEGPRILSTVEADDVESIQIGMRVRVHFGPPVDGIVLPTFQLEKETE